MLDFIFGPDGIYSQRTNLLWLGMHPNLLKEEELAFINNLQIPEICDKIWSSVRILRLNIISNLLKGACMVHKAQVDSLYNKTRNLFCFQQQSNLHLRSFNIFSDESYKLISKKRRKSKNSFDVFDSQQLLEETENTICNEETDFFSPDERNIEYNTTCRENDITLKENDDSNNTQILENYYNDDDELGEMTINEKTNFLHFISSQKKAKSKRKNVSTLNSKLLEENETFGFDLIRDQSDAINRTQFDQLDLSKNNFDQNNNTDKYIDRNLLNNTNNNYNGNIDVYPELSFSSQTVDNNINLPDYDSFLKNLHLDKTIHIIEEQQSRKRQWEEENIKNSTLNPKRRKIKLKIDKSKEFTAQQIISHIQNTSIFRCNYPRQDIIPKRCFYLKKSDKLISSPSINLPSSLITYFKRNLKRKKESEDISILYDIINIENIHFVRENLQIKKEKNNKKRVLELDSINQLDLPKNSINCNIMKQSGIEENLIENLTIENHKQNNKKDLIKNQICIQQIIKTIQNSENQISSNEEQSNSIVFRKLKNKWKPSVVLQKLFHLWNSNEKQITMEVLCKNCKRQEAAIAFSSIIQLSAKRYVNLIKEGNSIVNIKMGEEIISKF